MSKISKSPERHSFQREGYVKRQEELGQPVNEEYLKMFEKILIEEQNKFNEPESRKHNLEYDLLTTDWILEKARDSDVYAQNLYAALCNMQWRSKDLWPTLKEENWSCSWRSAGGIIADMQGKGDYIDWYCSGIRGGDEFGVFENGNDLSRKNYVPEGTVTEEIERDLDRLGWIAVPWGSNDSL